MVSRRAGRLFFLALLSSTSFARAAAPPFTTSVILATEADRAAAPAQLDLLLRAARLAPPDVQCLAVRALGRLERPRLVPDLVTVFSSAVDSRVRAEAANAMAQAAGRDLAASATARTALLARLPLEEDADASAAICEALGRLPLSEVTEAVVVERALRGLLPGTVAGRGGAEPVTVGALRGLESLVRLRKKLFEPAAQTLEDLRRLTMTAPPRVRRLALLVLNDAAAAGAATIEGATQDEDVQVRRLAAAAPGATVEDVGRGLDDAAPIVRIEALRSFGRRFQAQEGCSRIVRAVEDSSPHVALLALDLLGNTCRPEDRAQEVLTRAAADASDWHRPAHAVVSLARVAPDRASPLVRRFATAERWQLRMYAARAAEQMTDVGVLTQLADAGHPNVREAAIAGLAKVRKHAADTVYLQALTVDDGQLIITAARALEGTPDREAAAPAILSALRRLTASGRDTSRDPRLALLDRLKELGSPKVAAALTPLLHDADPVVAQRAAAVITAWSGRAVAAPSPRRRQPTPSPAEIERLARSVLRVTMSGGGHFDIRLLVHEAPLSCAAFARLAAAGYYNGLTFHRVVANFVVQGGSPGANEFSGHSRFMLDEVGRVTQARGTVGTSTRGRDTGDAQLYVNLVDNPRLDHDYTTFGEVISGMDVVDAILEGDTIERVNVVNAANTPALPTILNPES